MSPRIERAVLPIATYVIATEPLGARLPDAIDAPYAIYDTRFAFDYYRPLKDTRILWGGRISVLDRGPDAIARLLRRDLLRFARLQLRDADAAEDAVQEALAAAWSHAGDFAGLSAHKTWVFGILRNKLIDVLRARQRTVSLSALDAELDGESVLDRELFKENGHWAAHAKPRPWPRPDTLLQQQQFWTLFEACLDHLPEQIGRVFMMREFLDFEMTDICSELTLTTNHCSVLLYRARTRLRTCLSEQGLTTEDAAGEMY